MVAQRLTTEETDRVFGALADATRRDIVLQVIRADQSVSTLAERYAMSFAAVQKHVAVLDRAGLVHKLRRGREQIVSGDIDTVKKAERLLRSFEELWAARFARMDDLLAEDRPVSDSTENDDPVAGSTHRNTGKDAPS